VTALGNPTSGNAGPSGTIGISMAFCFALGKHQWCRPAGWEDVKGSSAQQGVRLGSPLAQSGSHGRAPRRGKPLCWALFPSALLQLLLWSIRQKHNFQSC